MLNKYNSIAVFYPYLSRYIFGKSLINIQLKAIPHLPSRGKILLIGGGNGEILPYIFKERPKLQIEYFEASSKMIELAKKKVQNNPLITFVHSDCLSECSTDINVVFAPFFFDLFSEADIQNMLKQLEVRIAKNFTLITADFQISRKTKLRQLRKFQIYLSILFFKLFTNHRLGYLPNISDSIESLSYKAHNTTYLHGNFLCLQVFTKP